MDRETHREPRMTGHYKRQNMSTAYGDTQKKAHHHVRWAEGLDVPDE
jgi:hypothetical protein